MAKMFSENAQKVIGFLQANPNVQLVSSELASAIGLPPRVLNGTVTSLCSKGFVVREPAVVGDKDVKFILLTDAGKVVDISADKPE